MRSLTLDRGIEKFQFEQDFGLGAVGGGGAIEAHEGVLPIVPVISSWILAMMFLSLVLVTGLNRVVVLERPGPPQTQLHQIVHL